MGSNREKSNIAIAILERLPFLKGKKIISHFDGSNNIFADCTSWVSANWYLALWVHIRINI